MLPKCFPVHVVRFGEQICIFPLDFFHSYDVAGGPFVSRLPGLPTAGYTVPQAEDQGWAECWCWKRHDALLNQGARASPRDRLLEGGDIRGLGHFTC